MRSSKEYWESHWVEALAMLPSYLFLAILISKLNLLLWIAVIFFAQYVLRGAYRYVVIERILLEGRATRMQRAIIFFCSQLLVWIGFIVIFRS